MTFKDQFLITCYRLLFVPLALTAAVFLVIPFHKKTRAFFSLKFRPRTKLSANGIWFHAASGEFEYCKPLIDAIEQQRPLENIFCSYSSPSYKSRVDQYPGLTGSGPLPLDLPGPVSGFLNQLKPKVLLVAKTDLWPELIFQTWQRKIPIVVFATVAKTRSPLQRKLSFYKRWMYNKCNTILCISEDDKKELVAMGVKTALFVTGDPRTDQISRRVQNPVNSDYKEVLNSPGAPILLAGSSWPEDEAPLFKAALPLLSNRSLRLVIAPHEPSQMHFENLHKQLQKQNLELIKLSQLDAFTETTVVYVDEVGILADLYSHSQISFIGGSFKKQVHSVGEAIGHGNYVLVGPYNKNNREAQTFKHYTVAQHPIVSEVQNNQQLQDKIVQLIALLNTHESNHKAVIQEEFQQHTGGAAKSWEQIAQYLQ